MMSGAPPYLVYPPEMLPEDPYLPLPPDFFAYAGQRGMTQLPTGGGGGGAPEIVPRFRKSPEMGDVFYDPYYGNGVR